MICYEMWCRLLKVRYSSHYDLYTHLWRSSVLVACFLGLVFASSCGRSRTEAERAAEEARAAIQKALAVKSQFPASRPLAWPKLVAVHEQHDLVTLCSTIDRLIDAHRSDRRYYQIVGDARVPGDGRSYSLWDARNMLLKSVPVIDAPTEFYCVYCGQSTGRGYSLCSILPYRHAQLVASGRVPRLMGTCDRHASLPMNPLTIEEEEITCLGEKYDSIYYKLSFKVTNESSIPLYGDATIWFWKADELPSKIGGEHVYIKAELYNYVTKYLRLSRGTVKIVYPPEQPIIPLWDPPSIGYVTTNTGATSGAGAALSRDTWLRIRELPSVRRLRAINDLLESTRTDLEKTVARNVPIWDKERKRFVSLNSYMSRIMREAEVTGALADDPVGIAYGLMKGDDEAIKVLMNYAQYGDHPPDREAKRCTVTVSLSDLPSAGSFTSQRR